MTRRRWPQPDARTTTIPAAAVDFGNSLQSTLENDMAEPERV